MRESRMKSFDNLESSREELTKKIFLIDDPEILARIEEALGLRKNSNDALDVTSIDVPYTKALLQESMKKAEELQLSAIENVLKQVEKEEKEEKEIRRVLMEEIGKINDIKKLQSLLKKMEIARVETEELKPARDILDTFIRGYRISKLKRLQTVMREMEEKEEDL